MLRYLWNIDWKSRLYFHAQGVSLYPALDDWSDSQDGYVATGHCNWKRFPPQAFDGCSCTIFRNRTGNSMVADFDDCSCTINSVTSVDPLLAQGLKGHLVRLRPFGLYDCFLLFILSEPIHSITRHPWFPLLIVSWSIAFSEKDPPSDLSGANECAHVLMVQTAKENYQETPWFKLISAKQKDVLTCW